MMIHYNDEVLFREFVAKGKAYSGGRYDFTFEDKYIIYHVKDVALRYIALDKTTGLASEVRCLPKEATLYSKTTYYQLFANILYSIKYTGNKKYLDGEFSMNAEETIDFIFRVVHTVRPTETDTENTRAIPKYVRIARQDIFAHIPRIV